MTVTHIGVIGATGTIGSRVVTEALRRGHRVTAFSRDASAVTDRRENLDGASVDVLDAAGVAAVLPGLDVLISGFQPGNAAKDFVDTVQRSIADPTVYAAAARALLKALESHPPHPADRHRWRRQPGDRAGCRPRRPRGARPRVARRTRPAPRVRRRRTPPPYVAAVRGHREASNVLRTSNRLWTCFSPAEQIAPGERTGRFRVGGDRPVPDADGLSRISAEDAAVALVDESEPPRFVRRRFTVGC